MTFRAIYTQLIRRITKIDSRIIVFNSKPDYADNSRALSDFLISRNSGYRIYWKVNNARAFKKKCPHEKVSFIDDIGFGKCINLFIYLRASYIFTTHSLSFYPGKNARGTGQ